MTVNNGDSDVGSFGRAGNDDDDNDGGGAGDDGGGGGGGYEKDGRPVVSPGRIGVEWDRSDLTPPPHTHRTCEVGPYTLH